MAGNSPASVKDVFKSWGKPRKNVSAIFSQQGSRVAVSASQNVALAGQKLKYFPPAIDIGSAAIKMLQLAKTMRGFEIAKIAYVPIERNVRTLKELKGPLTNLVRENKLKGEIVSSLSLNLVQMYSFMFPHMPEAELGQAVQWKMKQNPPSGMPFESYSVDFIYSQQNRDNPSSELRVLAFVVPNSVVIERINFFKELSLELVALEVEPYSVFSALQWLGRIPANETVLVLQMGARDCTFSIVHAGSLVFIKTMGSGGTALTEAIAAFHQSDWPKAEASKKQEGIKNWKVGGMAEAAPQGAALTSNLEGLVLEIENTFKSFAKQFKGGKLNTFDRLIVCGGSAGLLNLDKFLNERLEVPVEIFNPLASFNQFVKQELNPVIMENANSFAGALGSATRGIEW